MGGYNFEIIGVLEKRKAGFFGENEEDNAVYIPFRTAQKVAPAKGYLLMVIRGRSGQVQEALTQSEEILRRRRGVKFGDPNNFDIKTADKFIEQFDSITAMVGLIAIAISSLGLLVGGIGVMNIMLVSVTERTKEIGVRKAIGARRRDIVRQFLFEAMMLTFLGGVLGVLLAVGISQLIMFLIPSIAGLDSDVGRGHRSNCFDRCWSDLRRLARAQSLTPRSDRMPPLRMIQPHTDLMVICAPWIAISRKNFSLTSRSKRDLRDTRSRVTSAIWRACNSGRSETESNCRVNPRRSAKVDCESVT